MRRWVKLDDGTKALVTSWRGVVASVARRARRDAAKAREREAARARKDAEPVNRDADAPVK